MLTGHELLFVVVNFYRLQPVHVIIVQIELTVIGGHLVLCLGPLVVINHIQPGDKNGNFQ
jgi:hypothetical protein